MDGTIDRATSQKGQRRRVATVVATSPEIRVADLLRSEWVMVLRDHLEPRPGLGDLLLVRPLGDEPEAGCCSVGNPLAPSGSLRAGLYHIAARRGLDPTYPPAVLDETRRWQESPGIDDPALEDLTALPFITIDNTDSRDLDQAMHLERGKTGGYVLRYALADASYYVRTSSALFAEALERGASFYLPSLVIPMLPPGLSEGLISLNQDQRRRALVFEITLDQQAGCVATRLLRARICSVRKLSYRRVQRYYDEPAGSGFGDAPFVQTLELLREVGELRMAEARRRHVVDFNRREVEVKLGTHNHLGFSMLSSSRLEVERYNEQISLLCNVEGARFLKAAHGLKHVQGVFRVHPQPTEAALRHLEEQIESLIAAHDLDPDAWRWRRGGGNHEYLADYLKRLPIRGPQARITTAIERQALLSNERSVFRDQPGEHFGIGAEVYARFSSPMREIVGVFTHKEALEALGAPEAAAPAESDLELRARVLRSGNRAKEIQRQITKEANLLVLDALLGTDLDVPADRRPRRRGTILGMKPSLIYVGLDEPAIEVKVHIKELEAQTGAPYRADRHGTVLRPQKRGSAPVLRVGDPITLSTRELDTRRRRWLFQVVEAGRE